MSEYINIYIYMYINKYLLNSTLMRPPHFYKRGYAYGCGRWKQVILNSWYRQHPRYLWTWRSPGDRYRNQIDYVTINKRFRNAVTKVKTYPGADCGGNCDHIPVVAIVKLKLKRLRKAKKRVRKDWKLIKTDGRRKEEFQLELRNKYGILEEELDGDPNVNTDWELFSESLTKTAEEIVPNEKRRGRQRWMTEEILAKMEERRKYKTTNRERYNILDREIKQECIRKKEKWLNEKCLHAEQMEGRDSREMFDIIREITGKKRAYRGEIIKDRDANLLTDSEDVMR